jgi:hypothetical protein
MARKKTTNKPPEDYQVNKSKESKFPEEQINPDLFKKTFSDFIDKDYLNILIGSIVFHIILVVYFLMNPLSEEAVTRNILKMQEQLAKTIREREKALEEQYVQFDFSDKSKDKGDGDGPGKKAAKPKAKPKKKIRKTKKK